MFIKWVSQHPDNKEEKKLDLVPLLLDLATFHEPYYIFFGDGYRFLDLRALLLDLRALLLDLHALLLDLALPQAKPLLDRFSKPRLGRNSSDNRG